MIEVRGCPSGYAWHRQMLVGKGGAERDIAHPASDARSGCSTVAHLDSAANVAPHTQAGHARQQGTVGISRAIEIPGLYRRARQAGFVSQYTSLTRALRFHFRNVSVRLGGQWTYPHVRDGRFVISQAKPLDVTKTDVKREDEGP